MDKELRERLMADARRCGICADGLGRLRVCDREGLLRYYTENPDWCMERGFPGIELLRSEFSDCEDSGVFVGRTFDGEVMGEKQAYVFHECKGRIRVAMDYERAVIPMLYFGNGCEMEVECVQANAPAIAVPVYSFGENELTLRRSAGVRFVHYEGGMLQ